MKKILIALDYNPASEKIALEGLKLARQFQSELKLLHVLSDFGYYELNYPTFLGYEGYSHLDLDPRIDEELFKVAEDYLQTVKSHLDHQNVSAIVERGPVPDVVLQQAGDWGADMIIMGTHSHSVLEKILMGTTASKVLERTSIPVLMVPIKS